MIAGMSSHHLAGWAIYINLVDCEAPNEAAHDAGSPYDRLSNLMSVPTVIMHELMHVVGMRRP
jgi:hypothetical protein